MKLFGQRTATTQSPARPATARPILQVDGLGKQFGKTTAVDDIAFSVLPGETFGLLGPNGAGKTTTMKMLCGLIPPDRGDVVVRGHSVVKSPQRVQRMLGVVPQGLAIYEDMTARQNLLYFARLRGLSRSEASRDIDGILELVGLEGDANRKVKAFSGGMKRRLNIGIGLLGGPEVLLLDEPTVGIDPQSRRHILDSVRRLAEQGMTVIYTSHYMEEVEYLCRRVAIMDRGRIIAQGPIEEVRALAGDSVVVRVPLTRQGADDLDKEGLARAAAVPLEVRKDELRFVLPDGSAQIPTIVNALVQFGVPLDGLSVDSPNLETVFLSLTGTALRDDTAEGVTA